MKKLLSVNFLKCIIIVTFFLIAFNIERSRAQDVPPQDDSLVTADTVAGIPNIYEPGKGFNVIKGKQGSLNIGAYGLFRYVDQLPASQSYNDHLGRTRNIDTRSDFQFHRLMMYFRGFAFDEKFNYGLTIWNLHSTNQIAVIANMTYKFAKQFELNAGWGALPGTRSMHYSHPYWLAHDRVMADEYFRPYFTQGMWANGEILPRLRYTAMIGNNNSNLDITATTLKRNKAGSASLWWTPTTGEFGEFSSFSDYDEHNKLATSLGASFTHSRENRQAANESPSGNTTIKISDALNLFDIGALAPGSTVVDADLNIFSANAGIKYKGFFLQTEWYSRTLNKFNTTGPVPMTSILDRGFYVTAAYMVVRKKLELYSTGSQIWGQFNNSNEILGGINYYPYDHRYFRLNAQVIVVNRSPASSTFGYYIGGLKGTIVSLAASYTL